MTKKHYFFNRGFTFVELMVAISIIGILSAIVYANFGDARKAARDDIRKTDLKNLQLAVETYKAQNGTYPAQGCVSATWAGPGPQPGWGCPADQYIVGLVPDFIPALPRDSVFEDVNGVGFMYATDGTDYKLMVHRSIESEFVTSYDDEFARCPSELPTGSCVLANMSNIYAVYSARAAGW
jgi:prepilin-type N-terminal cleavage/methylation domain-containing protein